MINMNEKQVKQYHKYLNEDELYELMEIRGTNFYEVYK